MNGKVKPDFLPVKNQETVVGGQWGYFSLNLAIHSHTSPSLCQFPAKIILLFYCQND